MITLKIGIREATELIQMFGPPNLLPEKAQEKVKAASLIYSSLDHEEFYLKGLSYRLERLKIYNDYEKFVKERFPAKRQEELLSVKYFASLKSLVLEGLKERDLVLDFAIDAEGRTEIIIVENI